MLSFGRPPWPFIGIPTIKAFVIPKHRMTAAPFYVGACYSCDAYITHEPFPAKPGPTLSPCSSGHFL